MMFCNNRRVWITNLNYRKKKFREGKTNNGSKSQRYWIRLQVIIILHLYWRVCKILEKKKLIVVTNGMSSIVTLQISLKINKRIYVFGKRYGLLTFCSFRSWTSLKKGNKALYFHIWLIIVDKLMWCHLDCMQSLWFFFKSSIVFCWRLDQEFCY